MKKLTIGLLLLLIIFSGFYLNKNRNTSQTNTRQTETSNMMIVYQKINAEKDYQKIIIEPKSTALELLKKTSQIRIEGEGKNAFVTEINNQQANSIKKEFWAFYLNGKSAPVGAGSYELQPGDQIEWKIETY